MKYCSKCKLNVDTDISICPLCQNKLTGEAENSSYPKIPTIFKKFELFFKLWLMVSIFIAVTCISVNLIVQDFGIWWHYVLFGLFCIWVSMFHIIKRRKNIPNAIMNQVLITAILCIIWDIWTGWRGWSLDYVLPIMFTIAMIGLSAIARILKLKKKDYLLYLFMIISFCIITLIFYISGLIRIVIPSIICFSVGILSLSALLIFDGKNMKTEFEKRFHL